MAGAAGAQQLLGIKATCGNSLLPCRTGAAGKVARPGERCVAAVLASFYVWLALSMGFFVPGNTLIRKAGVFALSKSQRDKLLQNRCRQCFICAWSR